MGVKHFFVLFVIVLFGLLLISTGFGCGGGDGDGGLEVPAAPSDLVAHGYGEDIKLSWRDNSNNEDGFRMYYRCEYSLEEGFVDEFELLATVEADTKLYTHSVGLDKYCEYKVSAYNGAGESEFSNVADSKTAPGAPSDLSVEPSYDSAVGHDVMILRWRDNSCYDNGFEIERRGLGTDAWKRVGSVPSCDTYYKDVGVEGGASYEYRVRAFNDAGYSDYSNTASGVAQARWTAEVIDSEIYTDRYPSVAVDSNGNLHVSYYDGGKLKYATNRSGSWQTFVIDDCLIVGRYSSIAVDSGDNIHISYSDDRYRCLKYDTNKSGAWETFAIDAGKGAYIRYTSIALDSGDNVHIGFTNDSPLYATNRSGAWEVFAVSDDWGPSWTSIALDSEDNVHMSYYAEGIFYATNSSGAWQSVLLPYEMVDSGTSIAVDSTDGVYISWPGVDYYKWQESVYSLYCATNKSGEWEAFVVDSSEEYYVGSYASIAVDSEDVIHIAYLDSSSNDIKYATNRYGDWTVETVDSAQGLRWPSIAIDPHGKAHIVYALDRMPDYDCLFHAFERSFE